MNVLIRRGLSIRAGIISVFLVGVLFAGCSERASERDRLQGDTYLQLGKYDEAEAAYREAIARDDKNAHAQLGLGRSLAVLGNQEEALTAFRGAVETAPDFDLGYLELVNTLHELDRTEEALAEVNALEEVKPILGGVLRASLLRRVGQIDSATAALKALQVDHPESEVVRTHLASALLAAGDAAGAEAVLRTQNNWSTGEHILMADVLGAQGRVGELIERLEQINERSEDENLNLAYALLRDGQVDEGLTLVRTTLEHDPSSAWANYIRGAYLSEQNQAAEAVPLLRAAANDLPWEPLVMHSMESAQRSVSAALSPAEPSPDRDTVSETTDLDWQSLWQKASLRRLLDGRERVLGKNDEGFAETVVLSACILDDLKLAQELVSEVPADSPMRAYIAALAEKDAQKAIDALAPWTEREGREQLLAMNATAYALSLAGARHSAVAVLSECYSRYPENGVSLLILANVFRGADMPEFAAHTLRRLIANAPDNLEAHLVLFQVLRQSGSEVEARQAAEVMFALFPDSREAVMAACGIYVDSGYISVARRVVESYLESNNDDGEIKLALAAILFREENIDGALAALGEIDQRDLAPSVTMITALGYAFKGDWQRVVDVAASTDRDTMPLATRLILVAASIEMDQKKSAAPYLFSADKSKPVSGPGVGVILHALGDDSVELPDRERQFAAALGANDRALADFASGIAFQDAKLHDAAFQSLRKVESALAVENDYLLGFLFSSLPYLTLADPKEESLAIAEKHKENPRAWLGYASILAKVGDVDGRRSALDKALATGPNDPIVLLQRGDFFADQKEYASAVTAYRGLLELRPNDPVGNNNLAYNLLLTGGDPAEALKAAERAMEGVPYDAHVLHTLGVAQLRAGQLEASKESFAKALERRPGDPALLLDYGRLLIERGENEQGIRFVQSALDTAQRLDIVFEQRAEAEEILSSTSAN